MRNRDKQILVERVDGGKAEPATAAEATLLRFWDETVSGGVTAGADMTIEYLASVLEADSSTVREVAVKFELLGILNRNADGTVHIPLPSLTELGDLCNALMELDGILAAHLAADVRDGALPIVGRLNDLQRRVRRTIPIKSSKLSEQLDSDFRREIKALCHSSYLVAIHDCLLVLLERYRRICSGEERAISLVMTELEVVIDRIWAGDVDGARDAMREHSLLMGQHYIEYLSRHPNFQQQSVVTAAAVRHI